MKIIIIKTNFFTTVPKRLSRLRILFRQSTALDMGFHGDITRMYLVSIPEFFVQVGDGGGGALGRAPQNFENIIFLRFFSFHSALQNFEIHRTLKISLVQVT